MLIVVGALGDRGRTDLGDEGEVRAGGVLAAELHVVDDRAGQADGVGRAPEHLLAVHLQLVLEVDVAGRDEGVDARPARRRARPRRPRYVRSSARASPATITPGTSCATARVASKSPGEEIGNPASSTSTWSRASCCAISTFSRVLRWMPGDCSPSRSVVSKISDPLVGVVRWGRAVGGHGETSSERASRTSVPGASGRGCRQAPPSGGGAHEAPAARARQVAVGAGPGMAARIPAGPGRQTRHRASRS